MVVAAVLAFGASVGGFVGVAFSGMKSKDIVIWSLPCAILLALSLVLYFAARIVQASLEGLRKDIDLFGPLTPEELNARKAAKRKVATRHWLKFLGAVAGLTLLWMGILAAVPSQEWPGWLQAVLSVLVVVTLWAFHRWADKWRFIFRNRRVVGTTSTQYQLVPDWAPDRPALRDPNAAEDIGHGANPLDWI
jgi:hypothetical protein